MIKFQKELGANKNKKSKFLKNLAMLYLVLIKRVIIS